MTGDFSTPNEAYFEHVDAVLNLARDYGIVVILFPAYAGWDGGQEGWFPEMSALSEDICRQFGDFLGDRYAGFQNIIWASGGDYTLPVGSDGEACALALRDGILAQDTDALHTGHWSPESTSLAQATFASSIELNGIYTYELTYPRILNAWIGSHQPVFLWETTYEGEHSSTTPELRAQSWWAMLAGAAGQLSGNNPIYGFYDGWEEELNSPLSQDLAHLRAAFDSLDWWRLEPDVSGDFLVSGAGAANSDSRALAALGEDGLVGLVYLPPEGDDDRTITLDMSQLAGTATATWFDPSDGSTAAAGTYEASGQQDFTAPGANAASDADWALIIRVD